LTCKNEGILTANPTRVAILELQLQLLKARLAALDVKQKAHPARALVATVPSEPASGIEKRTPMS
jgi:hypothetical protein